MLVESDVYIRSTAGGKRASFFRGTQTGKDEFQLSNVGRLLVWLGLGLGRTAWVRAWPLLVLLLGLGLRLG